MTHCFVYIRLVLAAFLVIVLPMQKAMAGSSIPKPERSYIENQGQWDSEVLFLSRTPGVDVWITRTGVVYDIFTTTTSEGFIGGSTEEVRRRGSVISMEFTAATGTAVGAGRNQTPTRYSYVLSNGTMANAGLFREAIVQQVYRGIDVAYYFDNGVPRYDCIVHPGADYSQIQLTLHGAQSAHVAEDGSLIVQTETGTLTQKGLVAYQEIGGQRHSVPCSFIVQSGSVAPTVRFSLGTYNPELPVVIDPLVYAAFFGASDIDRVTDIAVDQGGNIYIVGTTISADFPRTVGAYDTKLSGRDIFLSKLDYTGTGVLFSTFMGGGDSEYARGLARDKNGFLYVLGETYSTDIPATRRYSYTELGNGDIFVAKFNSSGTDLQYLTVIGGEGKDQPQGIAVDDTANVYLTGTTDSQYFPTYPVSTETNRGGADACLISLNANGSRRYATMIGGTGNDGGTSIAMDPRGVYFWIGGQTSSKDLPTTDLMPYQGTGDIHMFYARYRTTGEKSLLGYAGVGTAIATSIAVDSRGDAFLAGYTPDGSFELPVPTIQPQYDKATPVGGEGILLKILPTSLTGKITYSTYLGSDYDDIINDITIAPNGAVVMVGSTTQQGIADSFFFDPIPEIARSVRREAFMAVLTPGERLLNYSTYMGGSDDDEFVAVAIGRDSSAYIAGNTKSQDVPVSLNSPEYQGLQDGLVVHIEFIPKVRMADGRREVNFGTVYVGDSKDESVVLVNAGVDLNTGSNASMLETMRIAKGVQFSSDQVVPVPIPPGIPYGELPVMLTFQPTTTGTFVDTVVFGVRYLQKPFEVVLRGRGADKPPPILVVQPDTLHLGKVMTGATQSGAFILRNEGVVDAVVRNIVLTGDPAFAYVGATTLTVRVGEEIELNVVYSPVAAGVTSAVLRIDAERATSQLVAVVQAEGVERPKPDVYLETYETDFGVVQVGRMRKAVVVVSNTGQTSATLSAVGSGAFSVALNATELMPNSSVGLEVVFAPTATGATTGIVQLIVAEQSTTLILTVRGEGVFPRAEIRPRDTLDLGMVELHHTGSGKLSVHNTGIDTLRVSAVSVTGGFVYRTFVPNDLAVGDSLDIEIDFTPNVAGLQNGQLSVVVDYVPVPVAAVLLCTGISNDTGPSGIAVEPVAVDFGVVDVSAIKKESVVIANKSTTHSVEISDIIIDQSGSVFAVVSLPMTPYSIAAGERDTVEVQFSPTTAGTVSGFMRVVSTVNTVSVPLSGVGRNVPPPLFDTVKVALSDVSAKIGEYANVQLRLGNAAQDRSVLQQAGVTGFSAVLRWNASVLLPVEGHAVGVISNGMRSVAINGAVSASGDEVLYTVPVRILWGDAEYASLSIAELQFLPPDRTERLVVEHGAQARLHITNVWNDDDGPRLLNANGGPLGLRVVPNPSDGEAVITVAYGSSPVSLVVYNVVGEAVVDLSSALVHDQSIVDIPLSSVGLSSGIYYCRLVCGEHTIVRTIIIRSQ